MDNDIYAWCFNYRWWIVIFLCTVLLCVYALYRVCYECCTEGLWSLHASLFNVMQDLPETLESWQCLTWAVLITVMARILIKSLFTYPGALWSLSGALVCSSTAASLLCVAMASLTQTAVPPSHSHGQHDEWHRTCRWTHPLRERLSELEVSHKAGKRQWVISEKVLLGLCFSGPAPNPLWTSHPPSRVCSWGCLMTPSYAFKLVQSKVQLVYNSTSNLWWRKPCEWDKQCHRNTIIFLRQCVQPKGEGSSDAAGGKVQGPNLSNC